MSHTATRERTEPVYRQIAENYIRAIRAGSLRTGVRLPSVRQTAKNEGTSHLTAVRAYDVLVAEGWVEANARRGYFVAERSAMRECCAPLPPALREVHVCDRLLRFMRETHRPGIVPLGSALPDPALYPDAPLRRALAAAALSNETLVRYPKDPWGDAELRSWVARRLALRGRAVSPDEVIITNGCLEAVAIALRATTKPGDSVIVEVPMYYGLLQTIEGLGLNVIEIPANPVTGADVDCIERALDVYPDVAACVLMPSIANPTGVGMPDESKRRLMTLLAEKGVPAIEDDVYAETSFDGTLPSPLVRFDTTGRAMLAGSFSKTLVPGCRLGWLVAGAAIEDALKVKFQTNVATNLVLQRAVAGYLDGTGYDLHLRCLQSALRRRSSRMAAAVRDAFPAGTEVAEPQGGMVLWVKLPKGCSGDRLADLALDENIAIMPGTLFSASGLFGDCIRLNAGLELDDTLAAGVARLGQLVEACRG